MYLVYSPESTAAVEYSYITKNQVPGRVLEAGASNQIGPRNNHNQKKRPPTDETLSCLSDHCWFVMHKWHQLTSQRAHHGTSEKESASGDRHEGGSSKAAAARQRTQSATSNAWMPGVQPFALVLQRSSRASDPLSNRML